VRHNKKFKKVIMVDKKSRIRSEKDRFSILITIGGGGFSTQSLKLVNQLKHKCDFTYVTTITGVWEDIENRLPTEGELICMTDLGLMNASFPSRIKKFFIALKQAYSILSMKKYDGVIAIASSISVPLLIVAKLKRLKTLYIESIIRVREPTLTGRIIYNLRISDRFYVQWEYLLKIFPKAVCKGRLW